MEALAQATFLSAIAANIIDALDSCGIRRLLKNYGVEKHLDNLKIVASRVIALIGVALGSGFNWGKGERVKLWIQTLERLENVVCDIDEVVDEPREALKVYAYSGLELSNKMIEFVQELEQIAYELNEAVKYTPLQSPRVITVKESAGFLASTCRDSASNNLIDRLLSKEHESADGNVSAIAVTGIGGIGKTALVKHVFDDSRVDTHFQLRIWVDVCGPFNELSTIEEILMSASSVRSCDLVRLQRQTLQEKLDETLRGVRFLLVLDDVQIKDIDAWDSFSSFLDIGKKGSAVAMTSRSNALVESVRTISQYKLDQWSSDDSWKLIKDIAFQNKDPNIELEETCKKITARLNNLPLAVKTFAELIKMYNMDDLKNIHKAGELLRELDKGRKGTNAMSVLLKMYLQIIPLNLKQCLMYCSLFPKGHKFDRTDLTQQWIALGFVHSKGDDLVEDMAGDYFNFLWQASFFCLSTNQYVLNESVFSFSLTQPMFDACPCPNSSYLWQPTAPKSAIHLPLSDTDLNLRSLSSQYKCGHLRSLVCMYSYESRVADINDDMCTLLGTLRVLDLSNNDEINLPDSVANLRHLRYLNLSHSRLENLPDSVCKLSKLQTLNLSRCYLSHGLPRDVTRLTNLRCLRAHPESIARIAGIGNLSMLQELEEFRVGAWPGFKIQELEHLRHLQGRLCIRNLENVGKEEAMQASLDNKARLRSLRLVWSARAGGGVYTDDEQVLGELKPHDNIEDLHLENYGGSSSPSWLTGRKLNRLVLLTLKDCHGWRDLYGLCQLKLLRFLELDGLDGVIRVGTSSRGEYNFPSLQELKLSRMHNWEEWQGSTNCPLFPSLSLLVITDCPKLTVLPQLPSCLRTLRMERVGLEILPVFMGSPTSTLDLVSLFISDCEKLTNLGLGLMQHDLRDLQVVGINNCRQLNSVPLLWFQALTSLKSLTISNCPKLNDTGNTDKDDATLFKWLESATYLSFVSITKDFSSLSTCTDEAVQYLLPVEVLKIDGESVAQKAKDPANAAVTLSYEAGHKKVKIQVRKPDELIDSSAGKLLGCLKHLLKLEINGCPGITIISGDALRELSALKKLSIINCAKLISVGVQALVSLEKLVIRRCSSLKSFVEVKHEEVDEGLKKLESLRKVVISRCNVLAALPPDLNDLPELEHLSIVKCPAIKCLPDEGLPESLKELVIRHCRTLARSVAGKDARKIADVAYKDVDGFSSLFF